MKTKSNLIPDSKLGLGQTSPRDGFTLVDLLAILAVVALLMALQVSAHASAKGRTKVATCASNVRQLALALHLYAGDNGNKLPVPSGAAAWPWDVPSNVAVTMLSCGLQKRTFYCPGTAPRFTDFENFADPAQIASPSRTLWSFGMPAGWGGNDAAPGFHIIGYLFAVSGSASVLLTSNQNTTLHQEPVNLGGGRTGPAQPNAERVLVADLTISSQAPAPGTYSQAQKQFYNYTDVGGGFYKHHLSDHLQGHIPEGGNLGFKDGHVAWRRFENMDQRSRSAPGFWW